MNFIRNALKIRSERKALNLTLKKLRPALGRLFGKHETYTPEQIAAAILKTELPFSQTRYGVSLYCSHDDYDRWAEDAGECDHRTTRTALADLVFGDNIGVTAQDVSMLVAYLNKPQESGYVVNNDLQAIYGPYTSG